MAYQTINPSTNVLVKTWLGHTDEQVEAALSAAHRRYKSGWSKGAIGPRLQVLYKLADLLESRVEELARIITLGIKEFVNQKLVLVATSLTCAEGL